MMKLLKYSDNWADEIEIEGFRVMTDIDWAEWQKETAETFEEEGSLSVFVGTNEDIEYESFEELMDRIEVADISETEAEFISEHLFNYNGFFPSY